MAREFKEVKGTDLLMLEKEWDKAEGEFVNAQQGQYGDNYILKIDGEEKMIFGNTVLHTKMSKVKEGTFVRITRLADKKSKEGRIYSDFKVETA